MAVMRRELGAMFPGKTIEEAEQLADMAVIAMLNIFIGNVVSQFNVGKNVSSEQTPQISRAVMKEFYFLKPDDFKMCFENAANGHYGKAYDRIDRAIVFEWLYQYCKERSAYFEERNDSKEKSVWEDPSPEAQQLAKGYTDFIREFKKTEAFKNAVSKNERDIEYLKFKTQYDRKGSL